MALVKNILRLIGEEKEELEDQPPLNIVKSFDPEDIVTVFVKKPLLEMNKIKSYQPEQSKAVLYEPTCLQDYIGQNQAKEQIKTAIKIIQELRPVHLLINGWAGCGKTTLARITAKMLKANFIYRVPEQLDDVDKALEVINMIQKSNQLTVFMLDEIHTLNQFPRVANILLPILQDWKYGDVDIRPFVMIGATTDKDRLIKKQPALVSRFQIQMTLDKYGPSELKDIIKNYKESIYKEHKISDEDYNIIAQNSRGIPREAIALMLKQLVTKNIQEVLNQSGIIKDGLTNIDLRILKTLARNQTPMGVSYLSQAASIPQADYEQIYERFLVEQEYICRQSRGRAITDKGRNLLEGFSGKEGA